MLQLCVTVGINQCLVEEMGDRVYNTRYKAQNNKRRLIEMKQQGEKDDNMIQGNLARLDMRTNLG